MYYFLAKSVLLIHLVFIVFVTFGSILLFANNKYIYFHLPCVVWGIYIQLSSSVCPLTYLENWLLFYAGLEKYKSGFLDNYIIPIIYPENLTVETQIHLGFALIIINLVVYVIFFLKRIFK